jgi:hypothetical protein
LLNVLGETAKDKATENMAHEFATMYFAREVAEGRMIRLAEEGKYVDAAHFDPTKHQRATDVRLEELTRADIEDIEACATTGADNLHRFLRTVLAVAELTCWDGRGSPLVWLWERDYLKMGDTAYEWTAKATRNKKLYDKLTRLPSLFSPLAHRPEA